jgi:hypothetical protein
MTIRARVTAHKGFIIIECNETKSTPKESHLTVDNYSARSS